MSLVSVLVCGTWFFPIEEQLYSPRPSPGGGARRGPGLGGWLKSVDVTWGKEARGRGWGWCSYLALVSVSCSSLFDRDTIPGPERIMRRGRGASQASEPSVCRRRCAPCAERRSCARTGP